MIYHLNEYTAAELDDCSRPVAVRRDYPLSGCSIHCPSKAVYDGLQRAHCVCTRLCRSIIRFLPKTQKSDNGVVRVSSSAIASHL